MISFDYLHRISLFEELALSLEQVPGRMHLPAGALAAALLVAAGSWAIQSHRLNAIVAEREALAARNSQQERILRKTRLYAERVRHLADLASRVRIISRSGFSAAEKLASIAQDLPSNVWLTEIAPEREGLALQGRTSGLNALSDALRGLTRDPRLGEATLASAVFDENASAAIALRFALHIAGEGS